MKDSEKIYREINKRALNNPNTVIHTTITNPDKYLSFLRFIETSLIKFDATVIEKGDLNMFIIWN